MPRLALLLAALALLCILPPLRATTIDPLTWEQLAIGADFLGVVECTTAGGIVAKVRVVESWKGPPDGTEFSLRIAVNYWEPQFPILLVGERWLVAAYKTAAPSRIMSTTSGVGVPFWWRDLPADYVTPLFQALLRLPLHGDQPLHAFSSPHPTLEVFRHAVRCLLEAPPEQQELLLLRTLAKKYVFDRMAEPGNGTLHPDPEGLRKEFDARTTVADQVAWLLALRDEHEKTLGWSIPAALGQGLKGTLAALEALPKTHWIHATPEGKSMMEQMRGRLGPRPAGADDEPPARPAPTADELAAMRKALTKGVEDGEGARAFETLTVHDPAAVAEWLRAWVQPKQGWQTEGLGYVLGSWFALRCGPDRAAHLKALHDARDPFVRVAGAVYLCFEDLDAGTTRLRDLSSLPGDPGAWAAITLVRRGEASALERALRVFETAGEGNMAGVPHRNFQKHLLTVLSNSAAAAGIDPPPAVDTHPEADETARATYETLRAWAAAAADRLVLRDPWLPELARQKVD